MRQPRMPVQYSRSTWPRAAGSNGGGTGGSIRAVGGLVAVGGTGSGIAAGWIAAN